MCHGLKSDRDHGTATYRIETEGEVTTAHSTLGLTPAGTISRSNLSLGLYPLRNVLAGIITVFQER